MQGQGGLRLRACEEHKAARGGPQLVYALQQPLRHQACRTSTPTSTMTCPSKTVIATGTETCPSNNILTTNNVACPSHSAVVSSIMTCPTQIVINTNTVSCSNDMVAVGTAATAAAVAPAMGVQVGVGAVVFEAHAPMVWRKVGMLELQVLLLLLLLLELLLAGALLHQLLAHRRLGLLFQVICVTVMQLLRIVLLHHLFLLGSWQQLPLGHIQACHGAACDAARVRVRRQQGTVNTKPTQSLHVQHRLS